MPKHTAVGIDVGTHQIKVVVSESASSSEEMPKIKAVGKSASSGLRNGYITNIDDATKSIKEAVAQAERSASKKISSAFISVGGVSVDSILINGSVTISRADNEITEFDMEKAVKGAENGLPTSVTINQKILHAIPISYKIDGKEALGHPAGMKGSKLEAQVLFVTCLESHLNDLIQSVENTGIEVEDVIVSPIACSLPILSKTQKMAGCVLANIGSETVSIVVYENDIPISVKVFPIGSNDITKDIALGLKIDIEEADKIKQGESVDLKFSSKKLKEIVEARLTDIFELIENHLKKIGKNELLPAGIIITGGGSKIDGASEVARNLLKIPARTDLPKNTRSAGGQVRDPNWAVAYGTSMWALEPNLIFSQDGTNSIKNTKNRAISWIKRLLP